MNLQEYCKKTWKWARNLYLTAFLIVNVDIGYDFFSSNLPRIERGETVDVLQQRKYTVAIDGKQKCLTLLGERHFYTKKENAIAAELVNEHNHFASEGGQVNPSYLLFSILHTFPSIYYRLGSGRWYQSVDGITKSRGHTIHYLEEDPLKFLSPLERIKFLADTTLFFVRAPISYYYGRAEEPFDPSDRERFAYKTSLGDPRDEVMAENLAELLKRDEIDDLLANVGLMHLEGVIRNL